MSQYTPAIYATPTHSFLRTFTLASYSLLSYLVGVAGLSTIILAYAGLIPLGLLQVTDNPWAAIAINCALLIVFALQHSVMARPAFKHWLNQCLPEATQRSHFVWTSGVVSAILVFCWQPITGQIWQVEGQAAWVVWAIFGFGWAYLLAATFAINHFDLFGLRQVWFAIKHEPYQPVAFKEHWMYRYSRHPIMLGVLIGIWALPSMDASLLMMSVGLTAYIAIGLYFEERDLIKVWGQQYRDYQQRVGLLWTLRQP